MGTRAYRAFLAAVVFSIAAHVAACGTMVTLLGPGLDTHAPAAARVAWVAGHPWLWRAGWLPWHASAVSDLAISAALVALCWQTRRGVVPALLGLGTIVVAMIPDQGAELLLDTRVVDAARDAVGDPRTLPAYVALEARLLMLTGTCATGAYTVMFVLWLVTAARLAGAVAGRTALLVSGAVATVAFAGSAWANVAPVKHASVAGGYPGFDLVVALNVVAFIIFIPWLAVLGFVVGEAFHATPEPSAPPRTTAAQGALARLRAIAARPAARDLVRTALAWTPFRTL